MATTAKGIVPQDTPKERKPLSKAHKAKLASALAKWRASLTPEAKAELKERNAAKLRERWDTLSERERKDRLAGVRAWQKAQKAAKRAEARSATRTAPGAEPKVAATPKGRKAAPVAEVSAKGAAVEVIGPDGTSKPSKANNVLANRRTGKAVAK